MRNKTIERCQSICNEVIINPKWRSRLAYVIEALEIEKQKNTFRRLAVDLSERRKLENDK